MPNTKPIGVAYADPALESVTVSGDVSAVNVTGTGTMTGAALATTTATGLQQTYGNTQGFYALSTAITANVTTTSAVAGSIGITSHATGVGKLFMADGTKWQYAVVA